MFIEIYRNATKLLTLSSQSQVHKLRAEAVNLGIPVAHGDQKEGAATGDIPSLKGYDFQGEPGGQSLEK